MCESGWVKETWRAASLWVFAWLLRRKAMVSSLMFVSAWCLSVIDAVWCRIVVSCSRPPRHRSALSRWASVILPLSSSPRLLPPQNPAPALRHKLSNRRTPASDLCTKLMAQCLSFRTPPCSAVLSLVGAAWAHRSPPASNCAVCATQSAVRLPRYWEPMPCRVTRRVNVRNSALPL
jgi:hypothetical protein